MLRLGSLVSYFVVFYKNGFSPSDLRRAQTTGGLYITLGLVQTILKYAFSGYFVKGSPDFINSRGQTINASDQVDAFGQAQSIGWFQ